MTFTATGDTIEQGSSLHPETLMMSYAYHPEWSEGAAKPPIFPASTYVFKSARQGKRFFSLAYGLEQPEEGEKPGLIYGRLNHPGLEILEHRLCLWDGAEAGAVFESGMAAIATTLLAYLNPGDVLLYTEPVYGGTDHFIQHVLTRLGIRPIAVRAGSEPAQIEVALGAVPPNRLEMIYLETPANPTNALSDIRLFADIARSYSTVDRRVLVAVDNTFLGPLWQHPLRHGADLVLYSATKYIGGHSDLIAGACLGSAKLIAPVHELRTFMGSMADPWTCWLLLRSLETMQLRMTRQTESARLVADFLASHPAVERVHYLGHLDRFDPQYEIYRRQCLAPGAMISFEVRGGEDEAFRLLDSLRVIKLAVSLGGTESLAEHPATMTHADVPPEEKTRTGVTPQLIRLSIGVEHPQDLIRDLEQALDTIDPRFAVARAPAAALRRTP
ncbi:MAG TPA: cystathionine gamma-synthase family protein [Chloroflexota bacterium]|nr:cystathionine gamma-synthase family protein [Chloroflexota bacterium]